EGYVVRTYANRAQAMAGFAARLPDLAVVDISLEDEPEGGFELCRQLRALSAELPIIFLTARDSELDAVSGLRLGADDILTKELRPAHPAVRAAPPLRPRGAESVAPGGARARAVPPRRCTAQAGERRGTAAPWRAHARCRAHAGAVGRAGGAVVAHRVLDRARAGAPSRPRAQPPAADGRRQRGAGRQHHHFAREAHPAQVPGARPQVRRPADRVRHGLPLGRIAARNVPAPEAVAARTRHAGAAVGRLPLCARDGVGAARGRGQLAPGRVADHRRLAPGTHRPAVPRAAP